MFWHYSDTFSVTVVMLHCWQQRQQEEKDELGDCKQEPISGKDLLLKGEQNITHEMSLLAGQLLSGTSGAARLVTGRAMTAQTLECWPHRALPGDASTHIMK